MPNKSDFQGTTGTDLSLFAELDEGQCSIMGYNWVALTDLIEKMQWLQSYQKQASISALRALMDEFQKLGKAVLVRQGPSCNMAVAGAIDCKLLYFPHSDQRCVLVKRIETVRIKKNGKLAIFVKNSAENHQKFEFCETKIIFKVYKAVAQNCNQAWITKFGGYMDTLLQHNSRYKGKECPAVEYL